MRRKFRELNPTIGTPTLEGVHRPTDRRYFEQLTLGHNRVIPTPYIGRMYRTMTPAVIADYEGVADTSWSTGATGNITGSLVANSSFNCIYHHFTVANQRTSSATYIMQPIRFTCDMPATPGATYDYWAKLPSENRCAWGIFSGNAQPGLGAMAVIDTFLVAASHAQFEDSIAKLINIAVPVQCQRRIAAVNDFAETTLEAIAPTVQASGGDIRLSVAYLRHRVNGSAVGTLQTVSPNDITSTGVVFTGRECAVITPIVAGDTYELDVWYKIQYVPAMNMPTNSGKVCYYIPTTRVSSGTRRRKANGANNDSFPWVILENVNYSPNFSRSEHTYNITLNGHAGWTLKDGSNGPHKMIGTGGWTFQSVDGYLKWKAPSTTDWVSEIELKYDREIPHISLKLGAEFAAILPGREKLYYRPANSGDYNTQTVSTDEGTINHAPCGVFNQGGSTTFNLVTWSTLVDPTASYGTYNDGRKSGGLLPTYIEVPTTITLSRTTL